MQWNEMCNRYALDVPYAVLVEFYQAFAIGQWLNIGDILPRAMAPGLVRNNDGERELVAMQFAFCPPGCLAPSDPKRPLNNARVESAAKWPWKDAVRENRCVLPLSEFREPCYWGETAGSEVYFRRADQRLLHVAGIYRVWRSADGKQSLHTMAFLMRPACPFIMDHGHHRQPLFLDAAGIDSWTAATKLTTDQAVDLVRTYVAEPELTFRHARDMAASWKSRQPARLKDRDAQLAAIDRAGPLGF